MSQESAKFSVQKISSLAKLKPTDPEQLEAQLQRILKFIAVLDELQLDDVEPFFGAADLRDSDKNDSSQPIRSDQTKESLPREDALKNSPANDPEFYLVPPVFD